MSRSVCVYHSRGPVRSLPGEAILPQSECRTRCVLWTLYHKAGRKGSATRGKRKKICLFRQMGLYYTVWEDFCPLRLAYGKPPSPEGKASFRALHGLTGLFHVKRGLVWPKLWAGKRILALSGLPMASHLPQRGRQVSASCRGFTGLFHVKRGLACPKPWAGNSACPLRLAMGKPPPPEGEASFRVLPWVYQFDSRKTEKAAKLSPRRLSCGK